MIRRKSKSQQPDIKTIKAAVLGQDGVGKSALTVRFLTKRFIGDYDQTAENIYHHHLEVNDQFVTLQIMDTAGQYPDEKIHRCAAFADIIYLVYSITDSTSFLEAQRIGNCIRQYKHDDDLFLYLVGNKKDLEHIREVEKSEGSKIAKTIGALFFEISTAEGYEETQIFLLDTLQQVLNKRGDEKQRGNGLLKALKLTRRRGLSL